MTHRGPNDCGTFASDSVLLGHRRLSIIDIDGGHQPMVSENGDVCLVFNGEIYNFRELRSELLSKGHRFKSASDSEVILRLYLDAGIQSVARLNGIFAFAIWDRRSGELHLVRDQMGVKPLYYAVNSGQVAFASEIKAIFELDLIDAEVDYTCIDEYLLFKEVSGDRTLFSGVRRLLPGSVLTISNHGMDLSSYWQIAADGTPASPPSTFNAAVDRLDDLLQESVRRQMISDVPLGTLCSGGVDSSLVTAIAAMNHPGVINTFSVGFHEPSFDESPYARSVAEHCSTHHHELRVSNDEFANQLSELIWHNDEPLHFPNSVQIYFVSKLAARHVTVVLTGEGADELFGGYPRYQILRLSKYWKRLPESIRTLLATSARRLGDHRIGLLQAYSAFSESDAILLNSSGSMPSTGAIRSNATKGYRRHILNELAYVKDPIARLAMLEQHTYLVSILNRQDKMSMAASIESRVPFLDPDLVRFANALPSDYKISWLQNKRILKEVAKRHLPASVVNRKKSGFGVPLAIWLRQDSGIGKIAADLHNDEFVESIFGPGSIKRLHQEHRQGLGDHSDVLWCALNLKLWRDDFDIRIENQIAA